MAMLRLVQVMRGDQHGHAPARQLTDQIPEPASRQRIDAAGRLVEKHDRRLVKDGAAKGEPLPPAAGQFAGQRVATPGQAGHVEHEGARRLELLAREAVDAAEEADVLIDGERLVQENFCDM